MSKKRRRGRPPLLSEDQMQMIKDLADEHIGTGRWVLFDQFTAEEARSIRRRLHNDGYEVSVVKHYGVLVRRKVWDHSDEEQQQSSTPVKEE